MNVWIRRASLIALCAVIALPLSVAGDEDDQPKSSPVESPTLNAEQQRAVGLRVARPIAAKAPERIAALGLVLDETTLITDQGDLSAAQAAERSASAELNRLTLLAKDGAGASMKMLEAAQAEEAKARSESEAARARFSLHWGPLTAQSSDARHQLIEALAAGRSLLVRADLPGRHLLGVLPARALLEVDGVEVPGRVLGAVRQPTELRSIGILVEVRNPPAGLGPGARIPLTLLDGERSGMVLPRDALLYGEDGAYVYKQVAAKAPAEKTRYVAVKVKLIVPYGDGWLVQGVDDDDDIVVHGTGVLWSLEGVGSRPTDDDDDD
jgi:hypothetical protein